MDKITDNIKLPKPMQESKTMQEYNQEMKSWCDDLHKSELNVKFVAKIKKLKNEGKDKEAQELNNKFARAVNLHDKKLVLENAKL